MACLTVFTADTTDGELLEKMAVYCDKPNDLATAKKEVMRRMARVSCVTQADKDLVDEVVETLHLIDDLDLDMPHQSARMRILGIQYHGLKTRLLERMKST